jgi:hypothetical protein
MDEIVRFKNSKGMPLLGHYSEAELQEWLRSMLHSDNKEELPRMLLINGPLDTKRYIKKGHYLEYCLKFLTEARPMLKQAVGERWTRILREYRTEPAMETEAEFERLLKRLAGEICPDLWGCMLDQKLFLVCDETEQAQGPLPLNNRFYTPTGSLLPLAKLFLIDRKETLIGIRTLLPFWYSIPFVVAIAAFFRRLKNIRFGKGMQKKARGNAGAPPKGGAPGSIGGDKKLQAAAKTLETELVSYGDTIDDCLTALENRWNTLLDMAARQDLLTDVKTLIRDRLRQALRGQKNAMFTRDSLEALARRIAEANPTLRELKNQDPLRQYIVLYMVKLLQQPKF